MSKFIVRVWLDLEVETNEASEALELAKSQRMWHVVASDPRIDVYDTQIADVRRKSES